MASNVHDTLFKLTFSQVEHAASLLRLLLPPELVAAIDWSTLTLCPGSFVDEALAEKFTDLLFSVMLNGRPSLLYLLFEHQSSAEALMGLRLLSYEVRIWEWWVKENPGAKRIPVVIPVVLHHSPAGWKASVCFEALFDVDEELFKVIAPYVPRFQFILDDVSMASDEELRARAMSALGRLVLLCFRHARSPEELIRRLGGWVDLMREVRRAPNGLAALRAIYRYMFMVTGRSRHEKLVEQLGQALGKKGKAAMMTMDDYDRAMDDLLRKEWAKDGRREILLVQLRTRFGELPEAAVARVNEAETEQLELWAKQVLSAPTLAETLGSD